MRDDLEEVLSKSKKQTSIGTVGQMRRVLVEALEAFPDADRSADAYKRALMHWYHGRQENSKRGSLQRLEENDATILERLASLENEVKLLRALLADPASVAPVIDDGSGAGRGL